MSTTRAHTSRDEGRELNKDKWSDVPFDPAIAAVLAAADQDGSPALHEFPPPQARERAIADIGGLVGQPDGGVSAEELAIPGPTGEIGATLYRPGPTTGRTGSPFQPRRRLATR